MVINVGTQRAAFVCTLWAFPRSTLRPYIVYVFFLYIYSVGTLRATFVCTLYGVFTQHAASLLVYMKFLTDYPTT